jgi:hypothetical protein
MIARRALCLSVYLFAASICVSAQCPRISVSAPTDVEDGQPITFTANVGNLSRDITPTFNWSVSAGTISSGQGTSTITVDTTYAGGQSSTATVSLGGLLPRCNASASATTFIARRAVARKFDEYGVIRLADERPRLDNLAIQLQNEPGAKGYVIVYSARGSAASTAATRLNTAKNHLVNIRGIESSRIITVNGGTQAVAKTELWVVPEGAEPPVASLPVVSRPAPGPTSMPSTRPTPSVTRPQTPTPPNHNLRERKAG